jgi:glycosyltransferase involved in cell wall biosynthesis
MRVSIVIPAYSARPTIGEAVRQSMAQAGRGLDVEVIVVDDGSRDGTGEEAALAGARVIRQANAGPAAARNRGWQAATGRVVCFTDADCVPAAGWVRSLLDGFTAGSVGAVAGSYDIVNRHSWLARWVHREIVERHARLPAHIRAFGSYNVAIPRYVLAATGGFDPSYRRASAEDNDLSYRILKGGWSIAFRPQARVAHHHPERIWTYLKEQFRHGFWRAKLYSDHPDMMSGDDYTRVKDRVEPFLVLVLLVCAGLAAVGIPGAILPLSAVLIGYTALHLSWPVRWCVQEGKAEALPYTAVTFLRGFARTLGLFGGILRFARDRLRCVDPGP